MAAEAHHQTPRFLLRLHDQAHDAGEGLEVWITWAGEAARYGVSAEIERSDLERIVRWSVVSVEEDAHRNGHAEDFQRWGRRGGETTRDRYGRAHYAALARCRWEQTGAREELAARMQRRY